jgi:diguanylate cyclase
MPFTLVAQYSSWFTSGTYAVALFCAGLAIGLAVGKRHIRHMESERLETRHMIRLLTPLVDWTRSLAADMSEYQAVVRGMSQWLGDKQGPLSEPQRAATAGLLAQLMEANEQLQQRLNHSEKVLQHQAEEISTYMSEARTDALTGLPNRRAFDEELTRRMAEWQRYGRALSVMMVDIDQFKRFNDTHGHTIGDLVLRGVAERLRRTMRESDVVVRFGGEEMSVILPGITIREACQAAHRARLAIEQARFTTPNGQLCVTVSVGVAQCLEAELASRLVQRADEALYAAKQAGRNRAYWHRGDHCLPVIPAETVLSHDGTDADRVGDSSPQASLDRPAMVNGAGTSAANSSESFAQVCHDLRRRLEQVMANSLPR